MNISDEAVEAAAAAIQVRFDKTMGLNALARATLEAAAPHLMAAALRDAADAIDAQRDESNQDRNPDEGWSVVDHRAGRFLGKTVAARMLRARASGMES